jgi:hypothetical protein
MIVSNAPKPKMQETSGTNLPQYATARSAPGRMRERGRAISFIPSYRELQVVDMAPARNWLQAIVAICPLTGKCGFLRSMP